MSIHVQCQDCGKQYRVGDDKAGKRLRCKSCGAIVPIPASQSDEFGFDDEFKDDYGLDDYGADDYGAPAPAPRRRSGSRYNTGADSGSSRPRRSSGGKRSSKRRKKKSGSKTGVIIGGSVGGVIGLLIVIGAIVAVARGASSYSKHEAVADEMMVLLEDFVVILEGIDSPESARLAAPKIDALTNRMQELADRAKKLPKISRRENDRLKRKIERKTKELEPRSRKAATNAASKARGEPNFMASMKKLMRVSNSLRFQ